LNAALVGRNTRQMGAGHAFGICVAAAMLAGCGGSQPPIGAPGAMPQTSATATHADRGKSWMLPRAKRDDLLYVSDFFASDVQVFSYSKAELVGTLTGFDWPLGECVDKNQDVFITNQQARDILEYAHGGTSPIATLSDPYEWAYDCAIDPTSGNLAVTAVGYVVIYEDATGTGTAYTVPSLEGQSCGYDNAGNLYVDGISGYTEKFALYVLPKGSGSLSEVALNQSIQFPGPVLWDGKYLTVTDASKGGGSVIYQFSMNGTSGTEVGSTTLGGSSQVIGSWYPKLGPGLKNPQPKVVIGADDMDYDVAFWHYPAGGSAIKTLEFHGPSNDVGGVAVSRSRR
jgi:hypothetical protein